MTQNASGFLSALGKDDDEDDVPRRRKRRADPAPVEEAPAPTPDTPAAPAPANAPIPGVPTGPYVRPRMPEPQHKTSVDLPWSLKLGLQALVDRDRRGPKAELCAALEAHLKAQGIEIPVWEG